MGVLRVVALCFYVLFSARRWSLHKSLWVTMSLIRVGESLLVISKSWRNFAQPADSPAHRSPSVRSTYYATIVSWNEAELIP